MSRDRPLPVVLGQTAGQRFDCHACTHCCRELVVRLLPSDRERIDARDWAAELGVEPYVRLRGDWVLNKHSDGRCVFLENDGKCRIHREHGRREKPLACQLFPFRIVPGAEKWRIGWRFDCPTVARSEGRPVHKHETDMRKLASGLTVDAFDSAGGRKEDALQDAVAMAVVRVGESWLCDANVSLMHGLSRITSMVGLLANPVFGVFANEGLVKFSNALAGASGDLEDRVLDSPSPRQKAMLRQAVFVHCERVRLDVARSGWRRMGLRWDQLRRARRFRKGRGLVPELLVGALVSGAPEVSFDQVEAVRPAADDARPVKELIVRYLRVTLDSRAFYGPAYYGWPVHQSSAALMLRLPIIGWLARYHAAIAGRGEIGFEDVVSALGRVDASAGRLKSLGSPAERLRLKYLLRDHGLMRLMKSYSLTHA